MAIRERGRALFSSCLMMVAVSCGSGSSKRTPNTKPIGDAGAAGEAGAPSAGAAGESVVGAAGEGGASGEGGAGGQGGEGGADVGPLVCEPNGYATDLVIDNEVPPAVCRGSAAFTLYDSDVASPSFVCCGASDTATPYTAKLSGLGSGTSGNGVIQFAVPEDAPLGEQQLAVTCTDSNDTVFKIDVREGDAPVVTALDATTISTDTQGLTLTGEHLLGVSWVYLAPTDGGKLQTCYVGGAASDTTVHCSFDGLDAGEYNVVAATEECGAALNQPHITVTEPAAACEATGASSYVQIQNEVAVGVCRDSIAFGYYYAPQSGVHYTCCGVSDSENAFGAQLTASGFGTNGNGYIQFLVPANADLGNQQLTVACADSTAENGFDIKVNAGNPPIVTGVDKTTFEESTSGLTITGSNLLTVSEVVLLPSNGGPLHQCSLDGENTATSVSCTFQSLDDGEYELVVITPDCGAAVNQPHIKVLPNF